MKNLDNYSSTFSLSARWKRIRKLKRKIKELEHTLELRKSVVVVEDSIYRKEIINLKTTLKLVLIEYEHLRFNYMKTYLKDVAEIPELTELYDKVLGEVWKI